MAETWITAAAPPRVSALPAPAGDPLDMTVAAVAELRTLAGLFALHAREPGIPMPLRYHCGRLSELILQALAEELSLP